MKRDWTEARAKVEREGECRVCPRRDTLDPAHIIPRSLGGGQAEDAIVPLCRDHHRQYDDLKLDLLPALSYAEQAEAVRVLGIERARRRISGTSDDCGGCGEVPCICKRMTMVARKVA